MATCILESTRTVSTSFGSTAYGPLSGAFPSAATEADVATRIRATSVTLKNLFVRVTLNSLDGSTTVQTRKNAANGNLAVTVGAGATGVFEDLTNSDSLADGDDANYQVVTGGTAGTITILVFSVTFDAAVMRSVMSASSSGTFTADQFLPLNGRHDGGSTEAIEQYTFRYSATLRRLMGRVSANASTMATVMRFRKNGANGSMAVSVGAGATGDFEEDNATTDSVVAGDEGNFMVDAAEGADITVPKMQLWVDSARFSFLSGQAGVGSFPLTGVDSFPPIGSWPEFQTTEANVKMATRVLTLILKNLFVNVSLNTSTMATVCFTRLNGVDGALNVSIGAGATGIFEDTTNSDTVAVGTDLNYRWNKPDGSLIPRIVATMAQIVQAFALKDTPLHEDRFTRRVGYRRPLQDLAFFVDRFTSVLTVTVKAYAFREALVIFDRFTRNVGYSRGLRDSLEGFLEQLTRTVGYVRSFRDAVSPLWDRFLRNVGYRRIATDAAVVSDVLGRLKASAQSFRDSLDGLSARLVRNVGYSRTFRDVIVIVDRFIGFRVAVAFAYALRAFLFVLDRFTSSFTFSNKLQEIQKDIADLKARLDALLKRTKYRV